jgi:hypothetical protein
MKAYQVGNKPFPFFRAKHGECVCVFPISGAEPTEREREHIKRASECLWNVCLSGAQLHQLRLLPAQQPNNMVFVLPADEKQENERERECTLTNSDVCILSISLWLLLARERWRKIFWLVNTSTCALCEWLLYPHMLRYYICFIYVCYCCVVNRHPSHFGDLRKTSSTLPFVLSLQKARTIKGLQ